MMTETPLFVNGNKDSVGNWRNNFGVDRLAFKMQRIFSWLSRRSDAGLRLQQGRHQARRSADWVDQDRIVACLQLAMDIRHAGAAEDDRWTTGALFLEGCYMGRNQLH